MSYPNTPTIDHAWKNLLYAILAHGERTSPRGRLTRELRHYTLRTRSKFPVLLNPKRKLSYSFMAAEAYWILTGDDRVETIAAYNKNIAAFSDDGVKFFGAYGPRIVAQIDYVVEKILEDPDTRQAGLTIWKENPPESRDVPCTVALWFQLRGNEVNVHVFMRSSDAWLGVPYDVFNFSMVNHLVCGHLNERGLNRIARPGDLYLTAVSSHLYEENLEAAYECEQVPAPAQSDATPELWHRSPRALVDALGELRATKRGDPRRWWETP